MSITQPFMPAPPYFRKHLYLREILPLLVNNEIVRTRSAFIKLVNRDEYVARGDIIIRSGHKILSTSENKLKHLTSLSCTEDSSLDIVPLLYWYNRRRQFVRALCYGFLYWLISGSEEDIRIRKLIFTGNRDRFEYILHELKPEIANIHFSGGAALLTTAKTAKFFQKLLELFHEKRPNVPAQELINDVSEILNDIVRPNPDNESETPLTEEVVEDDKPVQFHAISNSLFENYHKCPICGGTIDQVRKHELYNSHRVKETVSMIKGFLGIHQFCKFNEAEIEAYKSGALILSLPKKPVRVEIFQAQMALDENSGEGDWKDEGEFTFVENELIEKIKVDLTHAQKLLKVHQKNYRIVSLQIAQHGITPPVNLIHQEEAAKNEMEKCNRMIQQLQQQLRELE